ncbi:hypothetical protein FC89_GL000767 [Liquorilactobacillus ghanensis DSM 18630]|jgi:preprotein translocase subunit SecE|uniref:Preprotein translocase subunit SecE n=2 Tax=Liquorilactobacillus ghanensis TaxID=399370 RepID=A0A0R1VMN4_9LACO|nr:hypothetical protein FC89_GL000767 [Liquorilactobacillus ghanensis DSM 18630]
MKETTWPTRKEALSDTSTVIMTSILFAVFFAIVDFAVQWAINFLI